MSPRTGLHLFSFSLILALALSAAPCAAQTPASFEARLELLRNGKVMGESVFTLEGGVSRRMQELIKVHFIPF